MKLNTVLFVTFFSLFTGCVGSKTPHNPMNKTPVAATVTSSSTPAAVDSTSASR